MTQFAVLHVTKFKGSSGGIGAHIDRKHIPHNADESRRHLNKEYASFPIGETLNKSIERRIAEGYKSTRKIRKDAVKAVGVVLSGSHEQMKEIEARGNLEYDKYPNDLEDWVAKNKAFAEKKFGKENILRFTLHMDERTPHIHCVFSPITKDGRLHFKSFIDGKKELQKLQEDYAQEMKKFGLERGRSATETKRKHITTAQFYAQNEIALQEMERLREDVDIKNAFLGHLEDENAHWLGEYLEEREKAENSLKIALKLKERLEEESVRANKQAKQKREWIHYALDLAEGRKKLPDPKKIREHLTKVGFLKDKKQQRQEKTRNKNKDQELER